MQRVGWLEHTLIPLPQFAGLRFPAIAVFCPRTRQLRRESCAAADAPSPVSRTHTTNVEPTRWFTVAALRVTLTRLLRPSSLPSCAEYRQGPDFGFDLHIFDVATRGEV